MRSFVLRLFLTVVLSASLTPAAGSPPAGGKDADKLLAEGQAFRSHGQLAAAEWAFRQAAKSGNVNGAFAAGKLLLAQGQASKGRDRIQKLSEALGYLFTAATNGNTAACVQLSVALQRGIGVQTNLISAYAWLELAAERDPAYRTDLDRLVVRLDAGDVRQAQNLAREYQRGHWPADLVHPVDQGDPRLKVQGIALSGHGPLVVVNDATLAMGDTAEVRPVSRNPSKAGDLDITCLEIGSDYVLVAVAGESHWKLLSTDQLR